MDIETRRSGLDRREQFKEVVVDNRKETERRNANNYYTSIGDFVKDISIFKGLNNEQIQKILYMFYKDIS